MYVNKITIAKPYQKSAALLPHNKEHESTLQKK